ncbi:carbohydrate-binding protein [Rufibacter latericius]|uniref:Carbohydrate-binding protein n=1 Tax=Rufibacter latericius TaxID=2487040 RepID=A0A3M9MV51_9BACT|nr:carbohydrate-binding protein [Rufibacter latericius]RNI29047.1 carbohydrate-binding protein [Rufibacter latericius]
MIKLKTLLLLSILALGPHPFRSEAQQKPHLGAPRELPARVEGENFDRGGMNVAYYDKTVGNRDQAYRTSEDVDIARNVHNTGYHISSIQNGEWLEYTIKVAAGGDYDFTASVATTTSGKSFQILIDGVNLMGNIEVPNRGSYQSYSLTPVKRVRLSAGQHLLRFQSKSETFDVDYFEFKKASINPPRSTGKVNLILDLDIISDSDDAGALAVVHSLIRSGEVNVLAMMITVSYPYSARATDAINTYYGLPNIPIGTLRDNTLLSTGGWYNHISANYPHDLVNAPNATTLYKQILSRQPDKSVVIATIGPLRNIDNLMASPGGMDLIRRKVKRLVTAGGRIKEDGSSGTSFNFKMSAASTQRVINNWPVEAWFVPNQVGDKIATGNRLLAAKSNSNPVRRAYEIAKNRYNGPDFRPSWDQMGVLIAVRGLWGGKLTSVTSGQLRSDPGGNVSWKYPSSTYPDKNHHWIKLNTSTPEMRTIVENMMMIDP